jgi:hypothetical protein
MSSNHFINHWAFYVVLVALFLMGLEIYWRKRFKLSSLVRFSWIVLVGLIIAEWTQVTSRELSQPETLSVFIDGSDSVVKTPSRLQNLNTFLDELKSWAKEKKQPVRYYTFGKDLKDEINLNGDDKTLLRPASKIMSSGQGRALVISDGLWSDFARFRAPVYALQIGDSKEKDVWIEKVQPVYTAFLKHRLKIPVTIAQKGYKNSSVQISLLLGNKVVEEKKLQLSEDENTIEFSYFPEKMGEFIFQIKVEVLSGELSELNNFSSFRLRVVRDKMRVLHIGGKPSYDLKVLRAFLTRQPDVDLVSFYILRSLADNPQAKNSELSLIPFPYEELFSTELEKFDVVVLHNFDFNLYFQPFYLTNLARFIREGGAFLIVGGDQSIHRYKFSPLAPLFPFTYEDQGQLIAQNSKAQVVSDHPVISGMEFPFQTQTWDAFHKIKSHPDAIDLVEYDSGTPLISIRQVEKGRIVSVNTDKLWMLQMRPTKDVSSYGRFARKIFQYLTFDPEVEPRRLKSGPWKVGEEVTLSLAKGEVSDWNIKPLLSQKTPLDYPQQSAIRYKVPSAGLYEVKNSLLSEVSVFETESKPWRTEWKRVLRDDLKLKRLADESGGKFFDFESRSEVLEQPLSGRQIISAQTQAWSKDSPLLAWSVLLLALLLLGLDFFLRKRDQWDV